MSKISVIIPCFNQGAYLEEAVDSVLAQTFQDFEIIIVDDGSTDEETIKILQDYARPKTRVIRTDNLGLSAARNNGVREAGGEYILPLDADDKIGPGYLEEAVRILDRHPDIGIVYCEAAFFGMRTSHWHLPDYTSDHLLLQNIIFCTAFFRRTHWEKVGGYNINMIYGWEDWDFWLSLIHLGVKVYRIPRVLFFYRLREESMSRAMDEKKQFFMRLHAILNHQDLYKWIAEINIRIRASEMFIDTGMGFTPHQVIRQVIFGEERQLAFDLSRCGNIRQVRFHPINAPAAIRLDRVEVTDGDGRCHSIAFTQNNAIWTKDQHWLFQEQHPWMLLDLHSIVSPQKISIQLQYLAIGHEIYPEIIKIKEQEIEQKNRAMQEILQSTSWKLTRPLRRLKEIWQA
jgi:glycosyltransferase involved in cell wall biosynthesis